MTLVQTRGGSEVVPVEITLKLFIDFPGISSIFRLYFVLKYFWVRKYNCCIILKSYIIKYLSIDTVYRSNDYKSSAIKNKSCSEYLVGGVH